jgi:hypothetical protein
MAQEDTRGTFLQETVESANTLPQAHIPTQPQSQRTILREYPLVQIMPQIAPRILANISYPLELESWNEWFLTNYDERQKRNVFMSPKARQQLASIPVNIESNSEILQYINNELAGARKRAGARGIDIVRDVEFEQLPRRGGKVTTDTLISAFKNYFLEVQMKLKLLSSADTSSKENQQRIIKIIASKLPKGVALNRYSVAMNPKLLDLKYLREYLIERADMIVETINAHKTLKFNSWNEESTPLSELSKTSDDDKDTSPVQPTTSQKTFKKDNTDANDMTRLFDMILKLESKIEHLQESKLVNTVSTAPKEKNSRPQRQNNRRLQAKPDDQGQERVRRYRLDQSKKLGDVFPRAVIQVLDHSKGGTWTDSPGILDSGADITVGHLAKHGQFGKIVDSKFMVEIELMDKKVITSTKVCYINVRATLDYYSVAFSNVLVHLVDEPTWDRLIIGKPVLDNAGLSPESQIKAKGYPLKN